MYKRHNGVWGYIWLMHSIEQGVLPAELFSLEYTSWGADPSARHVAVKISSSLLGMWWGPSSTAPMCPPHSATDQPWHCSLLYPWLCPYHPGAQGCFHLEPSLSVLVPPGM